MTEKTPKTPPASAERIGLAQTVLLATIDDQLVDRAGTPPPSRSSPTPAWATPRSRRSSDASPKRSAAPCTARRPDAAPNKPMPDDRNPSRAKEQQPVSDLNRVERKLDLLIALARIGLADALEREQAKVTADAVSLAILRACATPVARQEP